MGRSRGEVLIVGFSTRAFAESAGRAGLACTTVDAFGDRDQKVRVDNLAFGRELTGRYSATAAVAAAAAVSDRGGTRPTAYVADLENHPAAVSRLAAGRRLLGNSAATLERAREPGLLLPVARAAGARVPATLFGDAAVAADLRRSWLRKPRRGGGGAGIAAWTPGRPLGAQDMVQERIAGALGSASFVADGRRAVVLGVARQLAGDGRFGAAPFQFSGALFPFTGGHGSASAYGRLLDRVRPLANTLAAEFGLRGVNGIDFILRDDGFWLLELNPRYTASMELIERASGLSVYDVHERACGGDLAGLDAVATPARTYGKAVLYARRNLVVGDTAAWVGWDDVRDVPFAGDHIPRGGPVCTVYASAADAGGCYARLVTRASALEQELEVMRSVTGSGRERAGD